MTTEKILVSASSVMSSVADTSATPARCRADGRDMRESGPSSVVKAALRPAVVGANATRAAGRRPDGGDMRESVPSSVFKAALRPAFVAATVTWALLLPLVPFVA